MKTKTSKLVVILSGLTLVIACEKENLTSTVENEEKSAGQVNVPVKDSVLSQVPDIVIDDPDLQNNALVSQCGEDYLTYLYDRYGRISSIRYVNRNARVPAASSDLIFRNVYMVDRFVYNNSGRLSELIRFNPQINSSPNTLMIIKNYRYDRWGKLILITTRKPGGPFDWNRTEYLYYDRSGNMIKKMVREFNGQLHYFSYEYDKSNRLIRISAYQDAASVLRFICDLFYDSNDNIERAEFYYNSPLASNARDMIRKWVVYYKYDDHYNPFRDLKLPVLSLFEWMDLISPANITAISFQNGIADRMVFYKYRYNNLGYPLIRYRVSPFPVDE